MNLPVLTVDLMEGFMGKVLLPDMATPRDTPPFHRRMWAKCLSDNPQVAQAAPRSHAKSSAVTYGFGLASALFRRDPYIAIISRTYAIATEFIRSYRTAVTMNERLRRAFGVQGIVKDAEDDMIVRMQDGYEWRVQALGFGGSVRGFQWLTQRPTLIIVDDAEDDEGVLSPDRRRKEMDWFLSALMPMSDPMRGRVRVVGTLLHIDSMLANLCADKEWDSDIYEAHNDSFSQILWPEMFNKEKLLQIRRRYESQNRLDKYNMEYRNRVVDTSSGYFRGNEFLPMTSEHHRDSFKESLYFWGGGDFAWSQREQSDYTVLPIVATDYQGNMYVYDMARGHFDSQQVVTRLFELQEQWNPQVWFNERGAIHNSLKAAIDMEQRRKGVFLNIQEMPSVKEKRVRARALQARMRGRSVYWDTEADWYPDAKMELLQFDGGKHDDIVDALAHIAIGIASEVDPDAPEDIEALEYEQRKRETTVADGRNRRTGY